MKLHLITALLLGLLLSFSSCAHKSGHGTQQGTTSIQKTDEALPNTGKASSGAKGAEPQTVYKDRNDRNRKITGHTKVKMREEGGVYLIPITVNGLALDFIFDTGASNVSISIAEAVVMARQGKITDEDIVTEEQAFSDAVGNISVGMVVRLRTLVIGDITLKDVEATVVDNARAPLLLGQTALGKFSKVTIDYDASTIEFN